MAVPQISTKRLAIDKSNTQMVVTVAVASFITIFCLVAAQAIWSQVLYQGRVTKAKSAANAQLKNNISAYDNLVKSYTLFTSADTNAIGGSSTGTGDNDGNNAKIILDALPNTYDFPALASSIENILKKQNLTVGSISGTDDQLAQQSNVSSPSPTPVEIPFSFTVSGANYTSVQQLASKLQTSIRPIVIDSMTVSGANNNMKVTVNAHTYYQPGKNLSVTKKVVK